MPPFTTIITPVKSESNYIVECISSLLHLDYPKKSYEIVVVLDKKATKEVKNTLKLFKGKIKVLKSKRTGSAANRNLGVSKANRKAKYFAFTDADCVVSKGWLKNLVARIEKTKDLGIIGGLNLVPKSDNSFAKVVGTIEQTLLGGGGSAQGTIAKKERFVPSIPNCNALYRKGLWQKNKQNEKLIVGQDGEFNYRLKEQGNKFMIIPSAIVWHHRTNNFKGYLRRMYKYGEAAAKIFRLHPGILKTRWYALLSLIGMIGAIILLILSFKSLAVLYILLTLIALYLVALALTTISVLIKTKKLMALLTPVLLVLQHSLYNIGFIMGLVN